MEKLTLFFCRRQCVFATEVLVANKIQPINPIFDPSLKPILYATFFKCEISLPV